jgi:hypothetical protein
VTLLVEVISFQEAVNQLLQQKNWYILMCSISNCYGITGIQIQVTTNAISMHVCCAITGKFTINVQIRNYQHCKSQFNWIMDGMVQNPVADEEMSS